MGCKRILLLIIVIFTCTSIWLSPLNRFDVKILNYFMEKCGRRWLKKKEDNDSINFPCLSFTEFYLFFPFDEYFICNCCCCLPYLPINFTFSSRFFYFYLPCSKWFNMQSRKFHSKTFWHSNLGVYFSSDFSSIVCLFVVAMCFLHLQLGVTWVVCPKETASRTLRGKQINVSRG